MHPHPHSHVLQLDIQGTPQAWILNWSPKNGRHEVC